MCIKKKGETAIKKKYLLLAVVMAILASMAYTLFYDKHPFVTSTNLQIKKTYSDFMGSGNGCDITYVDKEQNTSIEFEFNENNPYSDKKEEILHYINLKKLLD
jgi:hypothetical protein